MKKLIVSAFCILFTVCCQAQDDVFLLNDPGDTAVVLMENWTYRMGDVVDEVNTELLADADQEIEKGNVSDVKSILKILRDNEEKINYHGKRADAIVKGMLQHSRSSTGTKEPTDLNALVYSYLRIAFHGWRAKDMKFDVNLVSEYDQAITPIDIVRQDIGRVVLNLINNAFYTVTEKKKHNGDGYEPTVFLSTKKSERGVVITVKDNGMVYHKNC
jgi:signal transduction histidine kinase